MKVILLKAVQKVGKPGDVVEVSDGYANNALFPRKLAVLATSGALEALKKKQASVVAEKALKHELLERAIAALPDTTLTIKARANEKGHLFAKLGASEIAAALAEHRIGIDAKHIVLAQPIKELGTHTVKVSDGTFTKHLTVSIEQAQ